VSWKGETPIEVQWDLAQPAPRELLAELGIPDRD
jgi:hypothetical protein